MVLEEPLLEEEDNKIPLPPIPADVPRFEGWVKKKGRQMLTLWKWRYMVLEHNCLLWWKRIEHYKNGDAPWGYLDFNHIPPHISMDIKDEIQLEMPGRLYRLYVKDEKEMANLSKCLKMQEQYTRAWILRAQSDALESDLSTSMKNFKRP